LSGEGGGKKGDDPRLFWPFFSGVVDGAIGRPAYLGIGAIRTASWLGLNGPDARNNIVFHNRLMYLAARHALNYARHTDVAVDGLREIWQILPRDRQDTVMEWGAKTAGGMVGGMAMGKAITWQLSKYFPKRFVAPSIFFLSCQGFCASIWRDHWGGGPPPPPGGFGGGSGGISV
jgi:hypothetical protein